MPAAKDFDVLPAAAVDALDELALDSSLTSVTAAVGPSR